MTDAATPQPPFQPVVGPPASEALAAGPPTSARPPSGTPSAAPSDRLTHRRRRHPARRARQVAAGVSVATFAVLAGGLAVGATGVTTTSPPPIRPDHTTASAGDTTTETWGAAPGSADRSSGPRSSPAPSTQSHGS